MKNFKFILFFAAIIVFPLITLAEQSEEQTYVPEQLKPWVQWVKDRNPDYECIKKRLLPNEPFPCTWEGRLELTLSERGAKFTLNGFAEKKGNVLLPGGIIDHFNQNWVRNVVIEQNGKISPAIVAKNLSRYEQPITQVEKGEFVISGDFLWNNIPEKFLTTSPIIVIKQDNRIIYPKTENGILALQDALSGSDKIKIAADSLKYEIYRLYRDGTPFEITTVLKMQIAGKQREYALANLLPENAAIVGIESELPYSLQQNNEIILQLTAGEFSIIIDSILPLPLNEIVSFIPKTSEAPEHEIIAWMGNENFRNVELKGASSISADMTDAPQEWKNFNFYILKEDTKLQISTIGKKIEEQNKLFLNREMWLDFDGKGFSIEDNITGSFPATWQILIPTEVTPGKAIVNGQERLITNDQKTGQANLEIRDQQVNAQISSRMPFTNNSLSANGYDDINSLSINLNLPPGWSILFATGADTTTNNWLTSWSLFDIFIAILIVAGFYKLCGIKLAAVAFISLLLTYHQPEAPINIWIYLLVGYALLKYIPSEHIKTINFVKKIYFLLLIVLAVQLIPFAINHIKTGLYPSAFRPYSGAPHNRGLLVSMNFQETDELSTPDVSAPRVKTLKSYAGTSAEIAADSYMTDEKKINLIDPNAVIQTGAGTPTWRWQTSRLSWNGPVSKDQIIKVYLICPFVNLILSFVRVLLMFILASVFFKFITKTITNIPSEKSGVKAASIVFAIVSLAITSTANAQFPDEKLLKELEQKIQKEIPDQKWNTDSSKISINSSNDIVSVSIETNVDVLSETLWKIPKSDTLAYQKILVNNQESNSITLLSDKQLYVKLSKGTNKVVVIAASLKNDFIEIKFDDIPKHVTADANDWDVSGISNDGTTTGTVQFVKKIKATDTIVNKNKEAIMSSWFILSRKFQIGLKWNVQNVVYRIGDHSTPQIVKIPLIANERVQSSNVQVANGFVTVSFAKGDSEIIYNSNLSESSSLTLKATTLDSITEQWEIACSTIWQCNYTGISPTQNIIDGEQVNQYSPLQIKS